MIMFQYTEQDLIAALDAVKNGQSLQQASREWSVPLTILHSRNQGSKNRTVAAESQQRLSKIQENHLSNWVLTQEALGISITHS